MYGSAVVTAVHPAIGGNGSKIAYLLGRAGTAHRAGPWCPSHADAGDAPPKVLPKIVQFAPESLGVWGGGGGRLFALDMWQWGDASGHLYAVHVCVCGGGAGTCLSGGGGGGRGEGSRGGAPPPPAGMKIKASPWGGGGWGGGVCGATQLRGMPQRGTCRGAGGHTQRCDAHYRTVCR